MTRNSAIKNRLRATVIAVLLSVGPGGAAMAIPSPALADPGNPGIPTNPGTPTADFPTNPG